MSFITVFIPFLNEFGEALFTVNKRGSDKKFQCLRTWKWLFSWTQNYDFKLIKSGIGLITTVTLYGHTCSRTMSITVLWSYQHKNKPILGLGLDVDWDCQSYSWDKTVENHQSYQHGIVRSEFSKGFQETVQS